MAKKIIWFLFLLGGVVTIVPTLLVFLSGARDYNVGIPVAVTIVAGLGIFLIAGVIAVITFASNIVNPAKAVDGIQSQTPRSMSKTEIVVGTIAALIILMSILYPFICGPNSLVACIS